MKVEKNKYREITIDTYEKSFDKYLYGTPSVVSGEQKLWIDTALSYISKSSKLLEIGTGTGRDSDYIESLGYNIQRSDLPDSFIIYNKSRGKNIIKLNIVDIHIKEKYDFILANAVLLHFTKTDVKKILGDINKILNYGGILVFSLKKGQGEEFSNAKVEGPRFFRYWENEEIEKLLNLCGYSILLLENADSEKRIHIICKK